MNKSPKPEFWGQLTYFMLSNDCLIEITFHYFYFLFEYSWFLELQFNRYKLLLFLRFIISQILFFGVLGIIFASLIVDLFVQIYWISVYWPWNLSSGLIENCLWAVSKPDIRIFFPTGLCVTRWYWTCGNI